jgi:hypothetical protein
MLSSGTPIPYKTQENTKKRNKIYNTSPMVSHKKENKNKNKRRR